jgi:hypothetical protein
VLGNPGADSGRVGDIFLAIGNPPSVGAEAEVICEDKDYIYINNDTTDGVQDATHRYPNKLHADP